MNAKDTYLQPLGTLQLIAIIMVVLGHFWIKDAVFLNSACVSFCFVYSGFFTAMFHPFGQGYGLREHGRFMWHKLAKLYPLHVLGIALGLLSGYITWHATGVNPRILLAHLTLTSPWIADRAYYFGVNPVAWFICALFFLYLVAPLVVKLLRLIPRVRWQAVLILTLLALEFVCGYSADPDSEPLLLNRFHLYQFPPLRLLDFATGIVLFNASQSTAWRRLADRLTPRAATLIEAGAVILSIALYYLGKTHLHEHCYRAFCASAPAVVVLLGAFVFTTGRNGAVSRVLSLHPLVVLSTIGAEIYLLQLGVHFSLRPLLLQCGLVKGTTPYLLTQLAALLLVSWLVHRYFVIPIRDRLDCRSSHEAPSKGKSAEKA